jgi:Flp pilus assembly protein TadG
LTTATIFRLVLAICAAIYLLSQDNFTTRLALRLEIPAETNGSVTAMSGTSIRKRIRSSATRFGEDLRGNIAPIFAIALLPMLGFVGAAVDYTRANAARSSMQAAMDSAVLMVSKDAAANPTMTSQQITDAVQRYFSSLYHAADAFGVTVGATYTPSTSSAAATILATAHGAIKTDFMKVVGFPQLDFGTSSTSTWGNSRMRVAMVLDNTGSMADNGKMSALQSAAKNMIDSLSAFSKTSGDVYISIIPFSKDVNVGSSNYNADWINWADWLNPPTAQQPNNKSPQPPKLPVNWHAVGPGVKCPFTKSSSGFTCTSGPSNGASSVSTIPANGYICPSIDNNTQAYYNGCWESVATGNVETFCSGSSSCSCPTTSSGSSVSGCTCSGSGSTKSCSGKTYVHNWTQPGPNDHTHNLDQPRVSAYVGFKNRKWTSTTYSDPTLQVQNDWQQPSTNPISTWKGCITDRDQNYDTTNTAYVTNDGTMMGDGTTSTRYYAEQSTYCPPATITAMSDQWSTIKAQIDTMSPNGNTNQAVGLAWGWQSLNTTNGPIAAPAKDSTHIYQDYVVLLSDGLNTQNRWYTSASSIDTRQELLCQKVKDSGATVFTIQVNIGSKDPTSQVLQDCATNGNFQMITSATQTADAFQNILTQISQLRIEK